MKRWCKRRPLLVSKTHQWFKAHFKLYLEPQSQLYIYRTPAEKQQHDLWLYLGFITLPFAKACSFMLKPCLFKFISENHICFYKRVHVAIYMHADVYIDIYNHRAFIIHHIWTCFFTSHHCTCTGQSMWLRSLWHPGPRSDHQAAAVPDEEGPGSW